MAFPFGLGLKTIGRLCSGMWSYLAERASGRTRVELERLRNQGTTNVLNALPPGGEYLEHDQNGYVRLIRLPHGLEPLPPVVHMPMFPSQPVIWPPIQPQPLSGKDGPPPQSSPGSGAK